MKRVCMDEFKVVYSKQISNPNDVYSDCLGNVYYYDEHGTFIPEQVAKQYLEINNQ
ncbi:MAG: hypothetical protein WC503_04235 [Candidatus Shapirobacteria bacterium]